MQRRSLGLLPRRSLHFLPYTGTTIVPQSFSEVEPDHHTWVLHSYIDRSRRPSQTTIHGYYNRSTIVFGSRARPPYMGTTIVQRSFSEVKPDYHTWVLQSYHNRFRKSSQNTIHGYYNRTATVLGGRARPPYMGAIIIPQSFSEVASDHHTWVLQSYRERSRM